MFATLVICLPSKHEGGELIVSHGGHSQVVDFSDKGSAYDLQYTAFYADCEHKVLPWEYSSLDGEALVGLVELT